ncbi:hypothetical protein ABPG75_011719 [Micractinium tetrahymenae]
MKKDFSITFDNSTTPVVATGGWPANNAPLISSHKACDGWLHIVDAVLLPTAQIRDLPRLVDDIPDISQAKFWGLLDGTGLPSSGAAEAPAPSDVLPPAPAPLPHSNSTGVVVTGGNGTEVDGGAAGGAGASSSGGGSDHVLVVAASVAAGAVALCALLVGGVLLRKRQLRRQRQQHRRLEGKEEEEEEETAFERSISMSKHSVRPVTVHVDA